MFLSETYDHCQCVFKILNILSVDVVITFFLYSAKPRQLHFPEGYMTHEYLPSSWSVSYILKI